MKTTTKKLNLFLIGLFLINIFSAKAWNFGSEFDLKMQDNSIFSVHFDNNTFQYPDNHFSINNVKPGKHFLKVLKHVPVYGYRGARTMYNQVVYSGWIQIPSMSKVYAMIGQCNNYKVVDVISLNPACSPYGETACGSPINGHNCGTNSYNNGCVQNTGCTSNTNVCNETYGPKFLVMGDKDFAALKNVIANTSFDSNRLMIAKQAIANNYMTSAQVVDLMAMMSFESSRLDLAKTAYKFTIDKQNYFLVNNAFSFSSSVQELNRYINSVG